MIRTILIIFLLGSTHLLVQAQSDSLLIQEIPVIQETLLSNKQQLDQQKQQLEDFKRGLNLQQITLNKQKIAIDTLTEKTGNQQVKLDSLNNLIEANRGNIKTIAADLGTKITEAGKKADKEITKLGGNVEQNRLHWISATFGILLLGAFMYTFLGKRIKSSRLDIETQINNTKKSLEEESLRLDNKLVEILNSQLKVQNEETNTQSVNSPEKADHSLALKVADEIVRMQKNISRIDNDINGLKPLEKGIERIQANFAANGYEMVNLMNVDYDDRMNIDVINFNIDENLPIGKKLISKIIKPQVNFHGVLIQRAQVEISQN
jgi:hypothetical protein